MAYHNIRVDDKAYNAVKQVAADDMRSINRQILYMSEQWQKILSGELVIVDRETLKKIMNGDIKWVNM